MSDMKALTVGLSIAMPVVATLFVALRFFARVNQKTSPATDDYLAIAALIVCYGLSATTLAAVYLGNLGGHLILGPDYFPLNLQEFDAFQKALWILSFMSIPALGITKLSVLFFYKRIFRGRSFNITIRCLIGLVIVWNLVLFLINFLDCLPLEMNWHAYAGVSGKCIDIIKIFWAVNITDILTDALILAVPWPQIWKLQLSTAQKLQVCGIFMLGAFVVAAGIVRTIMSAEGVTSGATDLDYTYTRAPAVYWLVVEANVAVISACLPAMQSLIPKLKLDRLGSSLRQALSWGSRSSSTTLRRISSDDQNHLSHKQYNSYSMAQSVPMADIHHQQRQIEVKREFHRTDDHLV